jgi:tetratricopeptide (TPR) repeat protein
LTLVAFRVGLLLGAVALLFACHSTSQSEAQAANDAHALNNPKPEDLHALGSGFARSGDSVRAEHYFNAALEAGYPEAKGFPDLISACIAGGRLRSALSYAEPRLRRHPSDVRLRYLIATLYLGLGQVDRAQHHLDTVLSIDANDVEAHYLLASLQDEHLHNEPAARKHFEAYLALLPKGEHSEEVKLWLRQHPVVEAPAVATQSQSEWKEVGTP